MKQFGSFLQDKYLDFFLTNQNWPTEHIVNNSLFCCLDVHSVLVMYIYTDVDQRGLIKSGLKKFSITASLWVLMHAS